MIDRKLINFNVTPGDKPCEGHEIWAEIGKLFAQRSCGLKPCGPAKSGKPPVDVRSLCESLK